LAGAGTWKSETKEFEEQTRLLKLNATYLALKKPDVERLERKREELGKDGGAGGGRGLQRKIRRSWKQWSHKIPIPEEKLFSTRRFKRAGLGPSERRMFFKEFKRINCRSEMGEKRKGHAFTV